MSFAPWTIDLNGDTAIYVEATVTDDVSGVHGVYVRFKSPSGVQKVVYLSQWPAEDPTHWEVTDWFDPWTTEPGVWVVDEMYAGDRAENQVFFTGAQVAAAGWPTELTIVNKSYEVIAFAPPIDAGVVNTAKAGRAIPVKWHVATHGLAVDDPTHFGSITSATAAPGTVPAGVDAIEIYAGQSGLQYLGDGWWQYNWAVSKAYAGQTRIMTLRLDDASTYQAFFTFR
jgi:hypothetical protein